MTLTPRSRSWREVSSPSPTLDPVTMALLPSKLASRRETGGALMKAGGRGSEVCLLLSQGGRQMFDSF